MLTEGLHIFRVGIPASLIGKNITQSRIRENTGCSIIALYHQGKMMVNPAPSYRFSQANELILIGLSANEEQFFEFYPETRKLT